MSKCIQPQLLTIMDDFFNDMYPAKITRGRMTTIPAVNVTEHNNRYEIKLFIPGLDPKEIKIQLVDKTLHISYSHDQDQHTEGNLIREEYSHSSFERSLQLPKDVDATSIKAKSAQGVLSIIVMKTPDVQPKTVEIEIE